jgi:Rho-binding antiterminator
MKKADYIPISCHYLDRLEHWATLREKVDILYQEDGVEKRLESTIVDFITKEKVEYMKLSNGLELRLDWLISVNGYELPASC